MALLGPTMYGSDPSTSSSSDGPSDIQNIGFSTSVGSNALTINLLTKALASPSSGSPVKIAFRDVTSATGDYIVRSVTAATNIVIPSSATLGHQSAFDQYIYVVAIDNGGTVELGVIGSRYDLDEGSVASSTTISSSATDWNTIYSTTGRTSKAIRLLARIKTNEATAGTWATNSTEISLTSSKSWPDSSSVKNDLTFAPQNFGTVSAAVYNYNREKDVIKVTGNFTCGTTVAATASISMPTGLTIDTNVKKLSSSAGGTHKGILFRTTSGSNALAYNTNIFDIFYDGSTASGIFPSGSTNSNALQKLNGNSIGSSGDVISFEFSVPVAQWRSY